MGLHASLTVISRNVFDQILVGDEPHLGDGLRYSIDKAWIDFHTLFRSEPSPLGFAIAGDTLHPNNPTSFEEFLNGGSDYFIGFASPIFCGKVAVELSAIKNEELRRRYAQLESDPYDGDRHFFAKLRTAYNSAAKENNAIMISIV